jgi:hypothetical protein
MSEHSIKAYDYYKDLSQRAEYLIAGIIAAAIAFFWQKQAPAPIAADPPTLHLVGLIFLCGSMIAALYRIDREPLIFAWMSKELLLKHDRGEFVKAISQGKSVASGQGIMDPRQQLIRVQEIDKEHKAICAEMDKVNVFCAKMYRLRNLLLAAGLVAFMAERIWIPYFR